MFYDGVTSLTFSYLLFDWASCSCLNNPTKLRGEYKTNARFWLWWNLVLQLKELALMVSDFHAAVTETK